MAFFDNPETEQGIRCNKCHRKFSVKKTKTYVSSACNCGYAIIYLEERLKGVFRFISQDDFNLGKYYTSGRRKNERDKKDGKPPSSERFKL